ncbi:Peptidase family M48 [Parasphingorhabdus marina DSM 22363]|uniref:Peptidase family M48 n=1 Tax=Parasphingorhabdus marina DSM 22363 TaxID=1123272 RepID=A0A1N6FG62_9SPHN|nr:M48 family metallopeptidase [Parasphingorhabdus marina]SIN94234.1 Peptidase family M48 [Parasphingorhabdus marina DSM 22363]
MDAKNERQIKDFSESIKPGYQPLDDDEKGLWMQVDEVERELKNSNFIIDDPALNEYVRSVLCNTVGEAECGEIRLYLMRTPHFNASMAPNGMMQVWSGLLLRVQNEAQLAAVLAHEYGHYERRHSLQSFRDIKSKSGSGFFLSFVIPFAGLFMIDSIFSFNRDMEREADDISLDYLVKAGYTPISASEIWQQLRDEQDATAAERKRKSRKDKTGGLFATHPNTGERMETLKTKALAINVPDSATDNIEAFRAAIGPWWPRLIDDQIKLNDFGATDFLLGQLAEGGWTADLLYAKGELHRARGNPGDFVEASDYFQQSIDAGGGYPEIYRGLGLAQMRSGLKEKGQANLRRYLELAPDAKDKPMISMIAGVVQ